MKKKLIKVKLKDISQDVNSRSYGETSEDVSELMESIKEEGLLQPIAVTPTDKGSKFKYTLVYGNRRLRALKGLRKTECDAYFYEYIDWKDLKILNLSENLQRKDITAYQEGKVIYELMEEDGMTIKEISVRLGSNLARIKRSLHLFQDLPKEWRSKVINVSSTAGNTRHITKKGLIPSSIAEKVLNLCKRNNLPRSKVNLILKETIKKELTMPQIVNLVKAFVSNPNASLKTAISEVSKSIVIKVAIPIRKTDLASKFKNNQDFAKKVIGIVNKEFNLNSI